MITKGFIEKVCIAFSILNYEVEDKVDFHEFEKNADKRLSRCKELADAKEVVAQTRFCYKHWDKIEKIFSNPKTLNYFQMLECDDGDDITQLNDEEAPGTYWITNGLTGSLKDIAIASATFDDETFFVNTKAKHYKIFGDGEFYISNSFWSSGKMKLFDKYNNHICDIVTTKNYNIFLKNNKSNYYIPKCFVDTLIFERKYVESLRSEDDVDTSKILASIEWDLIKSGKYYSVAKLQIYEMIDEENDLELFLLFAVSTFLTYINKSENEEAAIAFLITRHFR